MNTVANETNTPNKSMSIGCLRCHINKRFRSTASKDPVDFPPERSCRRCSHRHPKESAAVPLQNPPGSSVQAMMECSQCSYATEWDFQLSHHFRKYHQTSFELEFHAIFEPEPFQCTICYYTDESKLLITDHSNHGRCHPMYRCEHCELVTHSSVHLIAHHESCRGVLQGFKSICELCCERSEQRPQSSSQTDASIQSDTWFQCELCSYRSLNWLQFDKHVKVHGLSRQFACGRCSYEGSDIIQLHQHNKWEHQGLKCMREYKCDQCSFKTNLSTSLRRHKCLHFALEDIAAYHCSKCSYRCRYSCSLKRHMQRHLDAKDIVWYKCDICVNAQFKQKSDLNKHKRFKHCPPDQVPRFKCDKCLYSSVRKNDVTKHMLRHDGGRRFKFELLDCPHCPFRAKRRNTLAKHILVHLRRIEEKMVKCPHCTYKANHAWQVEDHCKMEHAEPSGETWFKCSQCSYQSLHKKSLMKHFQIHCGPENTPEEDKWLKCKLPGCSYMCIAELKHSFKRHMLKHAEEK